MLRLKTRADGSDSDGVLEEESEPAAIVFRLGP